MCLHQLLGMLRAIHRHRHRQDKLQARRACSVWHHATQMFRDDLHKSFLLPRQPMMKYISTFITGAANTVSQGLAWIPASDLRLAGERQSQTGNDFVAYALSNSIAIVDDETTRILCTLRSPALLDDKLTILAYLFDRNNDRLCLFSGSEKGVVSVWTLAKSTIGCYDENAAMEWKLTQTITEFHSSITTLSVISNEQGEVVLAVSDATGNCVVFRSTANVVVGESIDWLQASQKLHFHPQQLPNAAHLFRLSKDCLCFAIGSVDSKLHLYISSSQEVQFKIVGSLPGHEEWITSIASLPISDSTTFVASASQDNKIRIWKIQQSEQSIALPKVTPSDIAEVEEDDDGAEDIEEDIDESKNGGVVVPHDDETNLSSEARLHFTGADNKVYLVFLESLLIGHEDWVTCVDWMHVPNLQPNGENAKLFSTSMDRNMVIWTPNATSGGIWEPIVRVGDIGGALGGSIGGNLLGFVGGKVSPNGDSIIGIGFGGSFHYWQKTTDYATEQRWFPKPFLTGHFDVVTDVAWEQSQGLYLVSVSSDQTCRIFSAVKRGVSTKTLRPLWKEISRPEIHGYNLNCLAPAKRSYEILTGGEEKLIRGFDVPNLVLRGLVELCGIELPYSSNTTVEEAYIPELGLSNKGKELMTNQEIKEQESRGVFAITWNAPPLESQLSDHTLWLETHKMFGHNNEVVCMAMSPCGKWLASSSKARYSHSCFVLLWSLDTHDLVAKLPGHESTASCLEFSPDGRLLASSGKDRSICIYSCMEDPHTGDLSYAPVLCYKSAHKRIIWDLSWTGDSQYLVTGSRDGTSKIWKVSSNEDASVVQLENVHTFSPFGTISVTALEIDKIEGVESNWKVVVGSEEGAMQIWKMNKTTGEPSLQIEIPTEYCHSKAVRRLRWRPASKNSKTTEYEWASAAEDTTVRIHKLFL